MSQAGALAQASNKRAAASLGSGETWDEAVDAALAGLPSQSGTPELALLFIDSRFSDDYAAIVERVHSATGATHLIGCSGQSVIGSGVELEDGVAVALMTLQLPGATLTPVALTDSGQTQEALEAAVAAGEISAWIALADPFSTNADALVGALEQRWPGTPVLGGLASAHNQKDGTAVFLDDAAYESGSVLLGLGGTVGLRALVAQGAAPIGQAWTITGCERNVIQTIGSRPALEVLQETVAALDPATRERAQQNLLVGLAMDEYRDEHSQGDFLIRNLMGADRESGSIAINALPREGQTFQFQVRDAAAAHADLESQLATLKTQLVGEEVVGAMLCACNGRGQGLFGAPHHDAAALAEALGPIPTAGLFCNGEIGPVGGYNFVHGFTASIALLTAPAD